MEAEEVRSQGGGAGCGESGWMSLEVIRAVLTKGGFVDSTPTLNETQHLSIF